MNKLRMRALAVVVLVTAGITQDVMSSGITLAGVRQGLENLIASFKVLHQNYQNMSEQDVQNAKDAISALQPTVKVLASGASTSVPRAVRRLMSWSSFQMNLNFCLQTLTQSSAQLPAELEQMLGWNNVNSVIQNNSFAICYRMAQRAVNKSQ